MWIRSITLCCSDLNSIIAQMQAPVVVDCFSRGTSVTRNEASIAMIEDVETTARKVHFSADPNVCRLMAETWAIFSGVAH